MHVQVILQPQSLTQLAGFAFSHRLPVNCSEIKSTAQGAAHLQSNCLVPTPLLQSWGWRAEQGAHGTLPTDEAR